MASQNKNATEQDLRPKITVVGVGGAGGNAVNNMIRSKLEGVKFLVANTDAQALAQSLVDEKSRIQLGLGMTQGLGAGAKPEVGRAAAEETLEEVLSLLKGSNMVFITGGMGGGTGTGAAPIIAKAAREIGILTVGVVTKPFHFEGRNRMRLAESGIDEMQQFVDTLIVIPNQNLFRIATENTTFADAFRLADDVLYSGVRGVTDLMMMPGLINLDFADIRTVMAEMGKAMMGTGEAEGGRRALDAAEAAISNPLLDDVSMKGARGVLINITGGYDMTLYEVDEAANRIRDEVDSDANIIFGSTFDERLNGMIRVSVVATGIGQEYQAATAAARQAAQAAATTAAAMESEKQAAMAAAPSMNRAPFANPFTSAMATPASAPQSFGRATTPMANEIPTELDQNQMVEVYEEETPSFAQGLETQATDELTPVAEEFSQAPSEDSKTSRIMPMRAEPEIHPYVASPQTMAPTDQPAPERRKSSSLFERFTGLGRKQAAPEVKLQKQPEEQDANEIDFLEIPAFLRKGGGGSL